MEQRDRRAQQHSQRALWLARVVTLLVLVVGLVLRIYCLLEPYLLQRWEWMDRQGVDRVLGDPRSHAYKRPEVHDWGIHGALHGELLNAMQEGFAFGFIALDSLLLEKLVNVRIATLGIGALRVDECLHAGRRIPRCSRADNREAREFFLLPGRIERGAFHRAHLDPNTDGV